MDCNEFQSRGKEMIEYICNYIQNIETRRVTPSIEPGYLRKLLPENAPIEPEDWDSIMADVETKIMPGVTHWQHPRFLIEHFLVITTYKKIYFRFHAYFPSGNSFPSILGDMLSDAIGCIGFSWAASPACTELETIVLDWLGMSSKITIIKKFNIYQLNFRKSNWPSRSISCFYRRKQRWRSYSGTHIFEIK